MGIDYKQKYLKYKIKYLNAKKKFKGGMQQGGVMDVAQEEEMIQKILSEFGATVSADKKVTLTEEGKDKLSSNVYDLKYTLNRLSPVFPANQLIVEKFQKAIKKHMKGVVAALPDYPELKKSLYQNMVVYSIISSCLVPEARNNFMGWLNRGIKNDADPKELNELFSNIHESLENKPSLWSTILEDLIGQGGMGGEFEKLCVNFINYVRACSLEVAISLPLPEQGCNTMCMPIDEFKAFCDSSDKPQIINLEAFKTNFGIAYKTYLNKQLLFFKNTHDASGASPELLTSTNNQGPGRNNYYLVWYSSEKGEGEFVTGTDVWVPSAEPVGGKYNKLGFNYNVEAGTPPKFPDPPPYPPDAVLDDLKKWDDNYLSNESWYFPDAAPAPAPG